MGSSRSPSRTGGRTVSHGSCRAEEAGGQFAKPGIVCVGILLSGSVGRAAGSIIGHTSEAPGTVADDTFCGRSATDIGDFGRCKSCSDIRM